jgi:hypothetical protein
MVTHLHRYLVDLQIVDMKRHLDITNCHTLTKPITYYYSAST